SVVVQLAGHFKGNRVQFRVVAEILLVQPSRFRGHGAIQIERTEPENVVQVYPGIARRHELRGRVDTTQPCPQFVQDRGVDEIDLVDDDPVRERNLVDGLISYAVHADLVEMGTDVYRVDHGHDRIQRVVRG